ncbi:hypothetical protein [Paenibacillus guangzhouensis]|uniref:hypothetical protein n=1 Tax=Paenibacillus guangzhouensis TaxID=1473112 RepID=UPI00126756A7|nr:hypothetical protein [Paenibacillus guangzhouensis]
MITYEDRRLVEEEFIRDIRSNPQYGLATFKLLYNLLSRISPAELIEHRFAHSTTSDVNNHIDQSNLSIEMIQLLDLAFQYASELDKPTYYTTGQMSTYFGVSITTINNWLREKRLSYQGMNDKPSYKQARIPDTAIYKAPNGKETILREIVQEYESQKSLAPDYDEVERMKALVKVILAFEEKYGGKYEDVVARLGDPESSHDWKWMRDADEWRYVMKEIAGDR